MVEENKPYSTARGVEKAIKAAAQKAAILDRSLDVGTRIQIEYFNRFLSRIFSEGADTEWALKGGTGMLARLSSARATRDVDLYRQGNALDFALTDLKRLALIDLGDHFRFEYVKHEPSVGTEAQPYTTGCRVTFNIFLGVMPKGKLQVDLVVGAAVTDTPQFVMPATGLELPKLPSNPYRLYPIVDQIADKVCATMTVYEGRDSSREKDLVDLVILALTQDVDGSALARALNTERSLRRLEPFHEFKVPPSWGAGYTKLSASIPYLHNCRTVDEAANIVSSLINPSLTGVAEGKVWLHRSLQWVEK